jgi:hypothetical protein
MDNLITSDELFHFTKFEHLIGIIENGFYPRYRFEHTTLSDLFSRTSTVSPVPMVCFCDIPITLTEKHSQKYSRCAIGVSKDWGYKKGLNPVIYVSTNSALGDAIGALANSFSNYHSSQIKCLESNMTIVSLISQAMKGFIHLSTYVKQYENNSEKIFLNQQEQTIDKGRFYDEREWRFVPVDKSGLPPVLIPHSDFQDEEKMKEHNRGLEKYKLEFGLDDIKLLIVENDEQKIKLLKTVSNKFDMSLVELEKRLQIKVLK